VSRLEICTSTLVKQKLELFSDTLDITFFFHLERRGLDLNFLYKLICWY
jgi:hypothetical protein